jgi:hypothetical protein
LDGAETVDWTLAVVSIVLTQTLQLSLYKPYSQPDLNVRSVDALLQHEFGLKEGLAHAGKVRWKTLKAESSHGKRKSSTVIEEKEAWVHRVQILDPATGTATFLYAVIQKIRERFEGNAGAWPGYVAEHLLPRLFGFELLMAPYAVAHMKLGLELERSGYDFASDERLGVFLTNSLEEAHEKTGLPLFIQWLADESQAASKVKRDVPVMVVLGNPPYSGHLQRCCRPCCIRRPRRKETSCFRCGSTPANPPTCWTPRRARKPRISRRNSSRR